MTAELTPPSKQQIADYYCSPLIAQQLVSHSRQREVAGAFPTGGYDKRPGAVQFPSDVIAMAKKGITSFHLSVERWSNPLGLAPEHYQTLRIGWDFVIDIDSKLGIDAAKLAAGHIVALLKRYDITHRNVKFSGRRGFHIVLPWEMFPAELDYRPLAGRYPEVPRLLARFVRAQIADDLLRDVLKLPEARQLTDSMNEGEALNPFMLIEVEKDWGNRHMFRAPYSLNEKTWLVSVPVDDLASFSREQATMEAVLRTRPREFFRADPGEAFGFLTDAMDWWARMRKDEPAAPSAPKKDDRWELRIGEEHFPPCMKLMLSGLRDGKKRSIFTLINFLRMMNWTPEEIEQRILLWNEQNVPPLPTSVVIGQLRYHERRERMPPANCDAGMYYGDLGLCQPDATCKAGGGDRITVKNPINYPFRLLRFHDKKQQQKKEPRGFSCGSCNQEFKSLKMLAKHKSKEHDLLE